MMPPAPPPETTPTPCSLAPPPSPEQELSNLLWSMATMDFWPGPAQVEAIAKVGPRPGGHLVRLLVARGGSLAAYAREESVVLSRPGGRFGTVRLAAESDRVWSPLTVAAQAAGAAAQRMKPQEMANTCWALATLRFFPGAALLDAMLAHAGGLGGHRQRRPQFRSPAAGWRRRVVRFAPLVAPGSAARKALPAAAAREARVDQGPLTAPA
jgi:hypothetical protein